jgi:hypothetical protein
VTLKKYLALAFVLVTLAFLIILVYLTTNRSINFNTVISSESIFTDILGIQVEQPSEKIP